jgi:ferric-dicitrate binding protein FerR (iron transport regulator)
MGDAVMRDNEQLELNKLILELLDGTISSERFAVLDRMITKEPEAASYYAEFIAVNSALCKPGSVGTYVIAQNKFVEPDIDEVLWKALAEEEKHSEAVEIEEPAEEVEEESGFVTKGTVAPQNRRVSRFSLCTAIVSTAALLMLLLYIWLTPPRLPIVATLSETANAKWADSSLPSAEASELRIGARKLIRGFARITFNKGAEVLVQAPSEFTLEGEDQIFLQSGKIFSTVPAGAVGFVVRTPGATVVDYGTEFGVAVDSSGQTEAHVFNGKVELRSGSDPIRFNAVAKLTAGMAGLIDTTGRLSTEELKAEPDKFVRAILPTSTTSKVRASLDLADVVGGGDGFGSSRQGLVLDPVTGGLIDYAQLQQRGWYLNPEAKAGSRNNWIKVDDPQTGGNSYVEVPTVSYIDGIFVPDGGSGPVKVSSASHVFMGCPNTNNQFWAGITNYGKIANGKDFMDLHPMRLGGRNWGTASQPGIFMHANVGVTFDLKTIRSSLPSTTIKSFRSQCGIGDKTATTAKADFWVLVDGQVRFTSKGMKTGDMPKTIYVELSEQDRFLTLVTTDSNNDNSNDWCIFAMPSLELVRQEHY